MTKPSEFQRTGNNDLADEGIHYFAACGAKEYDIPTFARDDFPRFMSLVEHLCPRDQEIILCYALLQKRPTDLSILFGKAGHRAEEDLHKAAHKIAGLAEFGNEPTIGQLATILERSGLGKFQSHSFAACLWQYGRNRDFVEMSRLLGNKGLRSQMLRAFKILHASQGREEGLLAGWILWLVDGSNPNGKGWKKRRRGSRDYKIGPTSFRSTAVPYGESSSRAATTMPLPPANGRGGKGQHPHVTTIKRHMKFILRGMNA